MSGRLVVKKTSSTAQKSRELDPKVVLKEKHNIMKSTIDTIERLNSCCQNSSVP